MIINKFGIITSVVISFVCLSQQQLLAADFGHFGYTVHDNAVTIDYYNVRILGGPKGSIVIPASIEGEPVTAIGAGAFNACSKVTGISIPPSVTSIEREAFASCAKLTSISIPEGVTIIEDFSFADCDDLANVNLPSGLIRIGTGAFSSCSSLELITIPGKVRKIGNKAFSGCPLKEITIPPSVKALGDSAFSSTRIRKVVIPETVKMMGSGLFGGCLDLKKVDFPAHFTTIPDGMFYNTGLTRIDISPTVSRIGARAFAHCAKISTVTLPKKIKGIGTEAFEGCKNLESAIFMGMAPEMGKHVFDHTAPDFRMFLAGDTKGYTIPRWHRYRTSLGKAEIAVQDMNGLSLTNGERTGRFGNLILGQSSNPTRFLIRNVGTSRLTGLKAKASGGDSSDFIVNSLSINSLAPGKTAVVEISFKPREKGIRASQLRIVSSDSDEDPFEIKLTGRGLELLK